MESIIVILLLIVMAEVTFLTSLNLNKLRIKKDTNPIFVDTSVLIDGRIIMVAKAGFMMGRICVPRSVIGELQYMADHADNDKRARARYGLDVIKDLQDMPGIKLEIFQDSSKAEEGVDDRLLNLAKKYNGMICTIDYNLNKVASVEGIVVLNINDLAVGLRMAYLPGERIMLELTQKGQDQHQAIGHLADGTMVVVEKANKLIGSSVEVEFVRGIQTAAGKMMFAKLAEVKRIEKPAVKLVAEFKPVTDKPVERTNNRQRNNFKKRNNGRPNNRRSGDQNLVDLANK